MEEVGERRRGLDGVGACREVISQALFVVVGEL
jgi:hypothetical protein